MMNSEYFTINEVCELLKISRPTLNSYRKQHVVDSVTIKGRIFFKKLDILKRFCFPLETVKPKMDLTVLSDFIVEKLEVAPGVFDLRLIRTMDAFGAICLMCCLRSRAKNKQHIYLLLGMDSASFYLQGINFFGELKRVDAEYVHYDSDILNNVTLNNPEIILPLHLIGYKGGEKSILDDIYVSLQGQGFSTDMCASLGWTLGELADNATTHAHGPCYFMLSSTVGPCKFLTLTIGDIGVGIPVTIKTQKQYRHLKNLEAFVSAFKSDVSSWDAHHKRGKGLNDLLGVAKGNAAWVRAESNGLGVFFDFRADTTACIKEAGTRETGTRFSIVLIDSQFDYVSKKEMNTFLDEFLEKL